VDNTESVKEIVDELRRQNKVKTAAEREIMNVREAAEFLGQSEWTLREWVRMRKVPFSKVNGAIKFRKSKLDRWIDRCEVGMRER
jgi:nitrogen PTS system EIIA component